MARSKANRAKVLERRELHRDGEPMRLYDLTSEEGAIWAECGWVVKNVIQRLRKAEAALKPEAFE